MHDAPSFKNWEGVTAARERLVDSITKLIESETAEKEGVCHTMLRAIATLTSFLHSDNVFVPPGRLVTMLEQAVSYQIELSRYRPKDTPVIHS